jgi:hypothetical protein
MRKARCYAGLNPPDEAAGNGRNAQQGVAESRKYYPANVPERPEMSRSGRGKL